MTTDPKKAAGEVELERPPPKRKRPASTGRISKTSLADTPINSSATRRPQARPRRPSAKAIEAAHRLFAPRPQQ